MSYLSEVIIGLRKCDYDRLLKRAKEKDIEENTQIHQYIQRGREKSLLFLCRLRSSILGKLKISAVCLPSDCG